MTINQNEMVKQWRIIFIIVGLIVFSFFVLSCSPDDTKHELDIIDDNLLTVWSELHDAKEYCENNDAESALFSIGQAELHLREAQNTLTGIRNRYHDNGE